MYALLTGAPAQGVRREGSGALKHFHLREQGVCGPQSLEEVKVASCMVLWGDRKTGDLQSF